MSHKTTLPKVSIFEAEMILSDAMTMLKKNEHLEPIKEKIVGDYWEEGWRRAPFEECMNFRQLASLQFDNLIKKKSFDGDKMVALAFAIRKAISQGKGVTPTSEAPIKSEQKPAPATLPQNIPLPASVFAMYLGLKQLACALPEGHSLGVASKKCFESVDPVEIMTSWLAAVYDLDTTSKLLGVTKTAVTKRLKASSKNIASIFHYAAPECYLHWSTALTGAGASSRYLMSPYIYARDIPKEFVENLCMMFLRTIGAAPVELKGSILPDHYSFTPKTAQKILEALKVSSKMGKAELAKVLSLPFPFFELSALAAAAKK